MGKACRSAAAESIEIIRQASAFSTAIGLPEPNPAPNSPRTLGIGRQSQIDRLRLRDAAILPYPVSRPVAERFRLSMAARPHVLDG